MSLQSAPFYWLICDGCGVKSTEDSDYAAWADTFGAYDNASDGDWACSDAGDFCPECLPPLCAGCGECNATTEHDDETWCDECLAAEVTG